MSSQIRTKHLLFGQRRGAHTTRTPFSALDIVFHQTKTKMGSVHFMVLAGPANWFQARSCCCVMEQPNVMMKLGWSWWWLSQGLICLFDRLQGCVCAHVCFSIWHKGYGLSYRGDRWYVYRRMFAFCTVFNYRVCVCHRLWTHVCERKTKCALSSVFYRLCWRGTGLYQSQRICSLPSSLSASCLNLTPTLLHFRFFSGKLSNPNLNWGCLLFTGVATLHK